MSDKIGSISSLDFITETIYKSYFAQWLYNTYLTTLMNKDGWKLKSIEDTLNFNYVNKNNFPHIKTKYNVTLIYVNTEEEVDEVIDAIMDYSQKEDLIGHIFTDTVYTKEGIIFVQVVYELFIYEGVDLLKFLNLIYLQIEEIKDDIKDILKLKILDPSNLKEHLEKEKSKEDDDDEDDEDDEDRIAPYDLGDK